MYGKTNSPLESNVQSNVLWTANTQVLKNDYSSIVKELRHVLLMSSWQTIKYEYNLLRLFLIYVFRSSTLDG